MYRIGVAALTLFIVGCSGSDRVDPIDPVDPVETTDLRAKLQTGPVDVTGVSVGANGEPLVFLADGAVYDLSTSPATMVQLAMPNPGVDVRMPMTDVVSLENGQHAVTAIGDGFVLDLAEQTLNQRFCYEPGFGEWEESEQATGAVAFDASSDLIFAQPQSYFIGSGEVWASSIGVYARATGDIIHWYELDDLDFFAGGMVFHSGKLVLGQGSVLYTFDSDTETLAAYATLDSIGVDSIDGMAIAGDRLLVLDNSQDKLFDIALTDAL